MMEGFGFWESWFVWRDAMVVALLSGAALSYLGVWVVLKRVVYVPLALAQVSSVGVVVAYLLGSFLGMHPHDLYGCAILVDPAWMSLVVALATAFWFARPHEDSSLAIVAAYLLSGAVVLILGGYVRQDLHDVQSVLFGNAVLVDSVQILYVGVAALVVVLVHVLLWRRFLFVSFDSDAAGAAGLKTFRTEVALYATFALMISVATRAIGALPAFGLMVLPAMTGLRLSRSMRGAFAISVALGIVSAGLGYYLSFRFGFPTGASMVGLSGLMYLVSLFIRRQ
ncbi:MAG: metal ABC transporter permease [Myxococcota bacterium]|nr:metal ABC transporter permease [Myxococcota bacterium]